MTIVCQNCSTRLQIDDDKAPLGAFTVRCPKCKSTVNSSAASPASEQSALAVGGSPSTDHPRYDQPTAPAYRLSDMPEQQESPGEEAVRMLINLLSKGASNGMSGPSARPAWSRRKALVCTAHQYRDPIARSLSENGYQVYVAEDM